MELLPAVNTILPTLGEHTVTFLDPKHPTVQVILNAIRTRLDDALLESWWFNTYEVTYYPDSEGFVFLAPSVLRIRTEEGAPRGVKRGDKMYNQDSRTYNWTPGVGIKVTLVERWEFEELPETVARMVMYDALVHSYATDIGLEDVLREWRGKAAQASLLVHAEHMRNKRYNTMKSVRYRRYRNALRG